MPFKITREGSNTYVLKHLPNMFITNISNRYSTINNKDTIFPNPSNNVDFFNSIGKIEAFSLLTSNYIY